MVLPLVQLLAVRRCWLKDWGPLLAQSFVLFWIERFASILSTDYGAALAVAFRSGSEPLSSLLVTSQISMGLPIRPARAALTFPKALRFGQGFAASP